MVDQLNTSFVPKQSLGNISRTPTMGSVPPPPPSPPRPPTGNSNNDGDKQNKKEKWSNKRPSKHSFDLFLVGSVGVFLISLLTAAGLLGYRYYLGGQIEMLDKKLAGTEATFEGKKPLIDTFQRLDVRLDKARKVLDGHMVLTPFFAYLGEYTLRSVRYTDFAYTNSEKSADLHQLTISGVADDYASLYVQSNVLTESGFITSASFSELSLNDDGLLEFKMTATVNPSIFVYQGEKYQDPRANTTTL